jgi:DegV family protein with EDD domain
MTVAIVTDSGSDLTPAQLADNHIDQIELSVFFGETSYLCPSELPPEKFWQRMTAPDSPFPHTAAPSTGQCKQAFDRAFAGGADSIVSVHLGETLSSTIKSAQIAAELFAGKQIEVVDSRSASMGVGGLALAGARMAAEGKSAAAIAEALNRIQRRTVFFVALETLEYLRRGGRISGARAAIGGLLSIKPIVTIDDGIILVADQPRTRAKARERTIELMTDRPLEELHVLYTPPFDDATFRDEVLARLPGPAPRLVTSEVIGPVIGTHVGPGAYGGILVRAE